MIYDLIIIGAGPAGITAAIYAARKRMNFIIITKDVGGQTAWSAEIENYTGYQVITGIELVQKFREHLEKFEVELRQPEEAKSVEKEGKIVKVRTDKGEYRSKAVILVTGRKPRMLGAEGEESYRGLGVTYCATCDAPLFSGKDVAVIGGGNSALDAVVQLTKIANKIYLVDIAPKFRADPVLIEKVKKSKKVIVYNKAKVKEILGDTFVEGMKIVHEEKEKVLSVEGVFIEIGSMPASDLIMDISKNEIREIAVNCQCETNIPGIFAAGDVTNVYAKQVIIACGEGAKAALASFEYLTRKKEEDWY